ncbi:hypothetical protein BKH42_03660 [Helicobacter sp. 13S00482-2]|uniref:hypothetical protein n=1 Tax=Helicobacter sp. 13S00482-2 TaxID=1476200 RepID=UPI000BA6146F|nr:hypothetical protein [Helicobacter sp. 13S00482-2]PAF53838.1 hypothetical protein BKH42_03660 [Helicobacter sp. 13S00482-2]
MKLFKTVLLGLLPIGLFAQNCEVGYKVLYTIASVERHPKRDIGYPYLISFNKTSQMIYLSKIKPKPKYKILDSRTIDCMDLRNCVFIYRELKKRAIKNLDLGAFQINPIYHKYKDMDYFALKNSLLIACSIVTNLKNKYGWSWKSLAKYHSHKKENNLKYQYYLKRYALGK